MFVTHPDYLREKARELRASKRLSIDELAERLALSRSTIYYWVRDMPIPGSGSGGVWPETARRKGTRAMQRKYRLLREEAYAQGLAEFDALTIEPTFRDFVCLYIAEGFRRDRNRVLVANSDLAVVALADRWIRRFTRNPVRHAIQYHADQDLDAVLGIDPTSIRLQRKSNSNQLNGRTWRSQYGVLAVGTNDTLLRARLGAWMDRLRSTWL
jgi:excisionase family DNA binding protein